MSLDDTPLHFDEYGMRQRERASQQVEAKLDHDLDVAEMSDAAGRIGTNAGVQNSAKQDAARKKREKEAQERREAIFIAMLNDVHDYGQAEIDAANAQMCAQDILQDMHDNDLLDPDNPAHAKIFKDAGLDPEDYRKRGQDALDDNKTRIDARRDRGYRIQDDVKRASQGDMGAAKRVEDIAKEQGIEVAAKQAHSLAQGNEVHTADEQLDSIAAQIENEELSFEIDQQAGFSEKQVETSVSMAADSTSRDGFKSGAGLGSLLASENPISSPYSPTDDFNAASSGDIFAEIGLEADTTKTADVKTQSPAQTTDDIFAVPAGIQTNSL